MRRASYRHPRRLESRIETFPLQVLDMVPNRGQDFGPVDVNRICTAPADPELVYVHDDEPGAVSLREALGVRERLLGCTEPSVAQTITLNIPTSHPYAGAGT
jgi:hypothetical protein